ncbi:MAG: hypothetical protein ACRDKS_07580, partial [Actinomycetota bacterium]
MMLIAAMSLGAAGPAAASCFLPADAEGEFRKAVASHPIVFVGVVMGTQAQGRSAIVNVIEVWRGPDFPAQVVVNGSPALEPNAATSVDRTFTPGAKYLFLPEGNRSPFSDNSCSYTREFTPDLNQLRPAGARVVAGPPDQTPDGGFPTVAVAL